MFGSLRKKLKEGVSRISRKEEEALQEQAPEEPQKAPKPEEKREAPEEEPGLPHETPAREENMPQAPEKPVKRGAFSRFTSREITENDIDSFFGDSELELLQSDVAMDVVDALKRKLKDKLVNTTVKRGSAYEPVRKAFEESISEILDQGGIDLEGMVREKGKEGKPPLILFLGFNGSGKTTTIAKTASYLQKKGLRPVLAAGDTFRAASIEQLEVHGDRLNAKVIKHSYGSDSAAVIFDARKYAEKARLDAVLADTAGRMHTDRNLMDELKKVVRVNSPDLKVLVVDSLTGNDAVEQARAFHEAVGVDCIVMTKTDVNKRGGSILSVVHTIGKPILFLGTGQEYGNVEMFSPEDFAKELLE